MKKPIYVAVIGITFLIILGCIGPEGFDDLFDNNGISGVCIDEVPELEGTWIIEGSGSRKGCEDETLNTRHYDLKSPPLVLVATSDEEGNIQFELGESISGFELSGAVDCMEVMFSATETYRGAEILHVFDGSSGGPDLISGTFKVIGPGSCRSDGSFRMNRQ
jgi:hypothetical protein